MKVVVIGGGVIGLFAAFECAQRGMKVTVVERNGESRDGCSYGNTGMVVPSHFVPLAAPGMVALALKWMWNPASPFYVKPRISSDLAGWGIRFWRAANSEHVKKAAPLLVRLAMESRARFEALAGGDNPFYFEKRGVLVLCHSQHALEEEASLVEPARSLGLHAEVLDPKAAAAREPDVRMDIAGAVHIAEDCNVEPRRLMDWLQRRAAAEFLWDTEVTGFRAQQGKIHAVRTSKGDIEADQFLLCAGSWTPGLSRDLGVNLPMQPGKGYSLTLPRPPRAPRACAVLAEARVSVSPMNGQLRFGGTMELAGLDETVNPVRVRGIVDAVQRYYPEFAMQDFEGVQPWRGLRPVTPDGLPYLGKTKKFNNLLVATGHAMMGVSLAPATAQIAADLLAGERPGMDLTLLSPERFN